MAGHEANQPPGPGAERVEDALGRLEERLDRASQAAERLLADAAQHATRKPPAAGWQQPAAGEDPAASLGADTDLLLGILGALRDRLPPDLQQRLAEAVREVLLALRALIDWYLERSERQRSQPSDVEDIPIL
ncbi:MAG: hypothetical protein ACXVR1_16295 [Solirubrobacteraceae bacterium]